MKNASTVKLTKAEIKKLIIDEVPALIKRDNDIRDFILKISSERFADKKKTEDRIERLLEELKKDREENHKRWEANQRELRELKEISDKRWQENQRQIRELVERWDKKWVENLKELKELKKESDRRWEENLKELKQLRRRSDATIGALGARWGLMAETTFRDAIKGILEEILPFKVERYLTYDEEGLVFGRPDQVELDLLIKDGTVIVAEIKSSISKPEVAAFLRKIRVYEQKEGRSVNHKVIISPMVHHKAKDFAILNGIKVFGYPDDIDIKELGEGKG